jgi:alcohol dehydrogenase (cytochrome c)
MRRLLLILACATLLQAQGLDPDKLVKPSVDSWPSYNGDYSGRRYSPLAKINQDNVTSLTLAWAFQMQSEAKCMPIVVNGVAYLAAGNQAWAVDARTGREVWHFRRSGAQSAYGSGHRGLAMYKDRLYLTTPDAQLLCLNARDGKMVWQVELADPKLHYFASSPPLVVRDRLIVGIAADLADVRCFIEAIDPTSGKVQWRWNVTPDPGEPGSETWPDEDRLLHGNGATWLTGTYDPELNLVYWGTGNPHPVEVSDSRPGNNLYTCSIVALNPETGKLVWHFQTSPHDTHDWDSVETPVLFDAEFDGKPRKLVAQAARNGYFFVLDRTNGKCLLTSPYMETTWASGIDSKGRPIPKKETEPAPDGAIARPGGGGGTNWQPPSFDPDTNLFYLNELESLGIYYQTTISGKAHGWGGQFSIPWTQPMLKAIDYKTGKIRWQRDMGPRVGGWPGILTTAGRLLFTADYTGNLLALDPGSGKTLWHVYAGGTMSGGPMTYELDGRQYLLTGIGSVLFAWSLPVR